MAMLRELGGAGVFPLRGERVVIGRSAECDVVLSVRRVSSRHAQILKVGGQYFIEDIGSSNGTYVNGTRIDKRTVLRPGDRLDFFGTILEFRDGDPSTPSSTPSFTLVDEPAGPANAQFLKQLNVDESSRTDIAPGAKLRAALEFARNPA